MEFIFLGTMFFTIAIMIAMGVAVKYYKAYWLISGYNLMSPEKKQKVDVVGLSKLIGNMCFAMAAVMGIATVLITLGQEGLGGILFVLTIPLGIVVIIKAQKYDGNTRNTDGTMKKQSKMLIGGVSAVLLLTTIGVALLMYHSNQPAQVSVTEGHVEIKGIYGENIDIKNISSLGLEENLPPILNKSNGYSLGSKKKGHFKMEGIGNVKLFLDTSKPPFIYIETEKWPIIVNCDTKEETEELFQILKFEWEEVNI